MKKLITLILSVVFVSPLFGQKVTLPAEVKATPGFVFVTAETDCAELKWVSPDGLQLIPPQLLKDSKTAVGIVPDLKPGQTGASYRLYAYGAKGDKASEPVFTTVVVGTTPTPPGPVPPGPIPPTPVPPTPVPPTPVPVTGFRVMIVTEKNQPLTKEQIHIVDGTVIPEYLNRKCVKDSDGRPAWRQYDKDTGFTPKELPVWKALWDSVKPQLTTTPAIVIVNDQKGQVFPLPATEAETLALLKKYGGE